MTLHRPPARARIAALVWSVLAAVAVVPMAAPWAHADVRVPTLVGSLQSELGCAGDWDPGCLATVLQPGAGTTYRLVGTLPAGSYEFKVALNGSWSENYGAGGVQGGANLPLVLAGPAALVFTYDDDTHHIAVAPTTLSGPAADADTALATDSLRAGLTRERFYFVMADRFANGTTGNDAGGLTGGRLETGLDPTDKGFYHGGDLRGLINRLDYIKDLGTTAIWLTPSFKNRPVQGSGADVSAGYHGTGSPTSPRSTRTWAPTPTCGHSSARHTPAG